MKIECKAKLKERFEFLFETDLIKAMCEFGIWKSYEADQMIMDVGQQVLAMPLVINGSIKILTEDKEGDELLLYYLELGDTCAVTLNCCNKKAKSTVRAITESKADILFVPVEKMEEWMIEFKSWRNYVLDSYNSRLNEMVQAIDMLVFGSMEERLLKYLRDKAWVAKSDILHTTHLEIANDLHSSRVVISRIMKKLEQQGLVKQGRNKVQYLEFSK